MENELDDIDEYIPNNQDDDVSEFCIAIYDKSTQKAIGSGVLLNSDGLFISAAHIFLDKEHDFRAYFDKKEYKIKFLCEEYIKGQKDLSIGILKDFEKDKYTSKSFPSLALSSGLGLKTKICVTGFKSVNLIETDLLDTIKPLNNLLIYKQRFSKEIIEPDSTHKSRLEGFAGHVTAFLHSSNDKYARYKGFSGGAVYINDTIYGIVLSFYFLNSSYIIDIIKKCNCGLTVNIK